MRCIRRLEIGVVSMNVQVDLENMKGLPDNTGGLIYND